jgi:CHAT domain-containing protein/tetratricopeptide (TPR) repeat protein
MAGSWTWHAAARIAILVLAVIIRPEPGRTEESNDLEALRQKVEQLDQAGKYADALAVQRRLTSEIETAETAASGGPGEKTAGALIELSWYALLAHNFKQALAAGDRAHALAPDNLLAETNRAHALLLMGRIREARAIYFAYKNKPMSMSDLAMWQDAVTNDVAALQKAGLDYAAVSKIANELGGPSPQSDQELGDLAQKVQELEQARKYGEALPLAQQCVALARKRYGENNAAFATAIYLLGILYFDQARHADAEPLLKRALAINEKILGPGHFQTASSLANLGRLYSAQGRYGEAEPLYKRAAAINEKALGPDHPDVGGMLNDLAELYRTEGRYTEAEPLFKRALAIAEKALGPDQPIVSSALNELAELYRFQGRYADAEPLYKRAIAIAEKATGPDQVEVGAPLNNLANLYYLQGRYGEAEPLLKRALTITEKALGPDHPDVTGPLSGLAVLYASQGRYAEAEPLMKRALAITEKALDADNPYVGTMLDNLAVLYVLQGRYAEAEAPMKRALAIAERALGPDHPDVGRDLNDLALLYQAQGRLAEAEPLYQRALNVREKALGSDSLEVIGTLMYVATLYSSQGDWARATDFARRGTAALAARTLRGTQNVGQTMTGKIKSEDIGFSQAFFLAVKAASRLASEHPNDTNLQREMFLTAQWAQSSEAAESLSQMAARGAKGDARLAALIRERQDLVLEWQRRDQVRSYAVAQAPDKRNREAEAENVARLSAIDARIAIIDKELAENFPDYAALASPAPLPVEAVQAQLGADEALVLFLDTPEQKPMVKEIPEETFIWVVTKTAARRVRSELGTPALTREIAVLRCGLDYQGAWFDDKDTWNGSRCNDLLKATYTQADHDVFRKPLPFDLARAHELYKALFGQIKDLIKDERLLIVPSGPLTQLPFQVLVTEPPKFALPSSVSDYRDVAWLARNHSITVLPAVSSLNALRELAKESHASEPYIGFGDPVLDGEPAKHPSDTERAKLAREKQCDPTLRQRVASLLGLRGGSRAMTRSNGGIADVADIRSWAPLPETADELCDVAHNLGVDPTTHLYLGAMATETKIKQLSESGALTKYKIVHFATHGAVAGDVSPASEPGLILTPPDQASETDDGYLSASEIAGLKLDADWVILSACNTAAAEAKGAEALSGLARAFFYAGARSLLVSHWEVASGPTVRLITKAIAELKANPKIGRAEALRRSMLSMIDTGKDYEAHPAFWAPFVLVGEGGPSR